MERFDNVNGDPVDAVVVVSVFREIAFRDEFRGKSRFVQNRMHFRIFDRGETVRQNGKSGDAAGHRPDDLLVMQRHFNAFIAVFVVHVMDDVQGVDVELGEPVGDLLEVLHDLVVVEDLALTEHADRGADLFIVAFHIASAVDRIEQGLRQIDPRPEELHLLADFHGGNAAGDAVIVAEFCAHQIIILILNGGGCDRNFRTEAFEVLRKTRTPEYRQIRFRRGSEIDQRVQEAVGHFRDHVPSVDRHAAERFGDPGRIPGEKLVVCRRAQKTDDPEFHDEVVDKFLNLLLREDSVLQVAFRITVEEGGDPSDGHRRAVLLLDRRQIREIEPLNRLSGVFRRTGDVESVLRRHLLKLFQGFDLFREFLALADLAGIHDVADHLVFGADLVLNEKVDAVEGNSAVVADDASAPVGVRQSRDEPRRDGPVSFRRCRHRTRRRYGFCGSGRRVPRSDPFSCRRPPVRCK